MREFLLPLSDGKRVFVRYYDEHAHGDTVFYLHGGPGDNCENFNYAASRLAEKINVVMIDQRGVLRSDKVCETEELTVNMLVDDCEYIRKALNISKIIPLGHSYGGLIALLYALKYPTSTQSVIYENPNWGTVYSVKAILENHANYLDSINECKLSENIRLRTEQTDSLAELEKILAGIPEKYREAVYYIKPWSVNVTKHCCFENITDEQWHNCEIHHNKIMADPINNKCFLNKTADVKCPQLLIRGDHDPVLPKEWEDWFLNNTNGRLATVANCGHYVHTDFPDEFCKSVFDFLEKE